MSHNKTGTRDKPLIQEALAIEHRVALRNYGRIDPGDLDEYVAVCQGYSGLESALKSRPEAVIAQLGVGGPGGRGNAGLDAVAEWQVCHDAEGDEKYAVCNAVDADPRSRTARLLLAGDPYSILEGLLIGAYVVGARCAFVGINADYGDEIALMRQAIEQMRVRGLLGEDVLGSGFSLDVTVMEVTGSLLAGEDTALLQALEERQMMPYLPLESLGVKGLRGKPTLIESAETFAKVASALRLSPAQPSSGVLNAARSSGTKVVTVHGLSHETTLEVPLGTTVGGVIEAVEGAPLSELDIKAVQFGGPTGRFLVGEQLDTPITAEAMEAVGTAMGSGGIKVFRGSLCAVEMARDAMSYLHEQSCGKCVACREGTHQLLHILNDFAEFKAGAQDIELMLELGVFMGSNSICDVGRNASAPVLSAIELFAADYKAHMDDKRCPGDQAHG